MAAEFRERTIDAGGLGLWIAEAASPGRLPLVLLHGIFDRWECWQDVMPTLARDYHVIVPDLRGHGRSDKPATGYDVADYAADIVHLLDALGIDQAAVVGHSLGALIAAALAAGQPERVRAVVLEDPPSTITAETRASFTMLLDAKRGTEEETYAALREAYWHRDEAEWRRMTEWLRGTADGPFVELLARDDPDLGLFSSLPRIGCPVLLLHADPMAGGALSDDHARRALELLRDGRLQRFPDTGHVIHRERPAAFVEAVTAFLESPLDSAAHPTTG